ncbi:MAG: peptidoglycan-associated lipoprotein Pal [Pseudomonadota bacterium]
MNSPRLSSTLLATALAAALAGCSSVKLDENANKPAPVEQAQAGTGSSGATSGVAPVQAQTSNATQADNLPRVVYFDFDSYVVKDEFRPVIDAHAKALNATAAKRLTLEGHTDERGGSEYNLALGQKRAEAVARALGLLGVSADRVEAVSFGKERPAVDGHDESAWSKNRRVEIKDR